VIFAESAALIDTPRQMLWTFKLTLLQPRPCLAHHFPESLREHAALDNRCCCSGNTRTTPLTNKKYTVQSPEPAASEAFVSQQSISIRVMFIAAPKAVSLSYQQIALVCLFIF
jgi:hypothetical protein